MSHAPQWLPLLSTVDAQGNRSSSGPLGTCTGRSGLAGPRNHRRPQPPQIEHVREGVWHRRRRHASWPSRRRRCRPPVLSCWTGHPHCPQFVGLTVIDSTHACPTALLACRAIRGGPFTPTEAVSPPVPLTRVELPPMSSLRRLRRLQRGRQRQHSSRRALSSSWSLSLDGRSVFPFSG